ncbi:hypothetical protein IU448_13645 [Nocardia flavorosea]|uniref:hypothetical protein n=1 Tax=Nocardia flavorosea TaxID=53429 RepID=UPI001894D0A5|nr:hypothetical protein [Nocardia flavorosea]MBF6350052.1 hypothetical protein [Nocardia flavorosea]
MTSTRGLLDELDKAGLDTALSEAGCLGLTVDSATKRLELDLEVLSLPEQIAGISIVDAVPDTEAERVRLTFHGVTRIAASLRIQRWDDLEPRILPLELTGLEAAVASFGGSRLHGWEFIDLDDSCWTLWSELLSFDTTIDTRIARHVLEFSQEEGVDPRELDIRVWFDSVSAQRANGETIPLPDLVSGSQRWWAAHDKGDPRASHPGIAPPL